MVRKAAGRLTVFLAALTPSASGVAVRGGARRDAPKAAAPAEAVEGGWKKVQLQDVPAQGCNSMSATVDSAAGTIALSCGEKPANAAAWATFADSLNQVGWSSLSVGTAVATDVAAEGVSMYAAGVMEGYLTAQRIREFHHNSQALLAMRSESEERLPKLLKALGGIASDLTAAATGAPAADAFTQQVHLAMLQMWGVRDGYALAVQHKASLSGAKPLSVVEMMLLNSDGVVDELLSKYGSEAGGESLIQSGAKLHLARPQGHRGAGHVPRSAASHGHAKLGRHGSGHHFHSASAEHAGHHHHQGPMHGHCTGFVRLTEDKSELYFAHTTWESFSEMTRIWKVYDFPLSGAAARRISFSSYPGCVSSTDDYYLMDSGLAITETTLNIPQKQQYPATAAAPDFLRIMASNRVSRDAGDWVRNMADSATGTYSSQWMVVDYKKFTPGSELSNGTFFILEQAPGISHYEDMSQWLQKEGYWASYDRAFFDDIREKTGDSAMQSLLNMEGGEDAQQAELYSKLHTPRAQIAKATAGKVSSLAGMREEMTRNLGTNEPVDEAALRVPAYAISARDDLQDMSHKNEDGSPDGGVDAKITSSCLFKSLMAEATSSPSHTTLPAFQWTTDSGEEVWPGYPHEGLPNKAAFGWVRVSPQEPVLNPLTDDAGCA